jgi:CheY-like chemotaxis protein
MNLCTNALHALENSGGTITIALNRGKLPPDAILDGLDAIERDYVHLSVADNGTGIDPEIQDRIFDPYFTTKEMNKGTGMGLATVHGIVKSYDGTVFCNSVPEKGATFHVYLPMVAPQAPQAHENTIAKEDLSPGGREHILLIDDEQMIVEMSTIMLEGLGYKVTAKTKSQDALAVFQQQPHAYDLVITDQTMPEMTGVSLAQKLLITRPDIPIILCTGYSNVISEDQALSMGICAFIQKPISMHKMACLIREVLDT